MFRTSPLPYQENTVGRQVAYVFMVVCAVCLATIFLCGSSNVMAQETHRHGAEQNEMSDMSGMAMPMPVVAPRFIASTAKPFAALMDDAMTVMDYGMAHAPMNGKAEHDFMTMMLPHHQGAVDMARAMLLYSDDPEVRNLALGIITEQQTEIQMMQLWLQRHDEAAAK